MNPSANQGTQVASASPSPLTDFKFLSDLPEGFVESLFGSGDNPVLGPVHSPDYHYYFYFQKDHGFLAKQRMEAYDSSTKEKFDVVTLTTSLYSN